MSLGPRLDLRTAQTLVISPQLQAAIKLLALSNLELQAEVANELERNPLIDLADDDGLPDGQPDAILTGVDTPPAEIAIATPAPSDDINAPRSADHDMDVDMVEERFHHDSAADSGRGGDVPDDMSFDSFAAEADTLADHLERQTGGLSPIDQAIARQIIASLDEAGYLLETTEAIALQLGIGIDEVERVLAIVQGFDPTGVGARSLAECIALQAREVDRFDPCMEALVNNLDLVARGDLAQLRRVCEVDSEDLADMLSELRSYNPKPGLAFGSARTVTVVPDVFVRRGRKGWTVELNTQTLPRLIVNRQYLAHVQAHGRKTAKAGADPKATRADRQFLDQCVSQAQWLVRALDQRASTILKVVTALVQWQEGFFEHGVTHLKPLTLRQIADEVGVHESTVSRVTSNKYLSCERGLFELKYLFTTAIASNSGEEGSSAEAVRARLKALIEAEPPLKPLSDDKLVDLLKQEGFELARRTVTKYREAMSIPSSFDRRRRAIVKAA